MEFPDLPSEADHGREAGDHRTLPAAFTSRQLNLLAARRIVERSSAGAGRARAHEDSRAGAREDRSARRGTTPTPAAAAKACAAMQPSVIALNRFATRNALIVILNGAMAKQELRKLFGRE